MNTWLKAGLSALWLAVMVVPANAIANPFSDMGVVRPKTSLPAPDFTLTDMDGERHQLSDYRGEVVLIHFWATWCLPCRAEMPAIHRLSRTFDGKGLKVLCVNVDRGNRQAVEDFMQDIGLHFHTLLDPQGEVRGRYEVFALPTSYIIGRDGKIIGRAIGERNWDGAKSRALIGYLLAPSGEAAKKPVRQVESDT
ncbi:MAG: TlpA disulfide reductase family protein [Mariprofundaceae bacterium]|nr:TlpA disulfide reductase family protein [Mariprofundaceae bacterium]